MELAKLETANSIGTITMCHNQKRNALSKSLIQALVTALNECRNQRIRAVVLRAQAGARVWSSGHDVGELPKGRRDPLGWDDPLRLLIRQIEECPAPVIALIEGGVWGGACEVAFACDIVLATPNATFALTPARLGVPYNVSGMLTLLNATNPRIAREMAFTAKPISAERAERLGIINYVVEPRQIEQATYSLAEQIAVNAPLSVAVMKEQLRILSGARPMSPQGFERIQGLRRIVYDSADYQEGIRAFKEKRKPEFRGE